MDGAVIVYRLSSIVRPRSSRIHHRLPVQRQRALHVVVGPGPTMACSWREDAINPVLDLACGQYANRVLGAEIVRLPGFPQLRPAADEPLHACQCVSVASPEQVCRAVVRHEFVIQWAAKSGRKHRVEKHPVVFLYVFTSIGGVRERPIKRPGRAKQVGPLRRYFDGLEPAKGEAINSSAGAVRDSTKPPVHTWQ